MDESVPVGGKLIFVSHGAYTDGENLGKANPWRVLSDFMIHGMKTDLN